MRVRYGIAAVIAVMLVVGALRVWYAATASTPVVVQDGNTIIRVDRVTVTTQEFAGLTAFPPSWVMEVPYGDRLWAATHSKYSYIGDGLKVVLVEGAVRTPTPLGEKDLDVRIVCGDYTMGNYGVARNITASNSHVAFHSRSVLGAHMPVLGVDVKVGDKWIRAWNAK